MIDGLSAALSGIHSAERRVAASAHNVANLQTEDLRPLRATQSTAPGGGSQVHVHQEAEARPVHLARELALQMLAGVQFQASLRVLEVEGDLRGRLVDLRA